MYLCVELRENMLMKNKEIFLFYCWFKLNKYCKLPEFIEIKMFELIQQGRLI